VAQTKKRRRRKHRGTQGGSIDTRGPRGRPRTREEAKARARAKQGGKSKQKRTVDRRDVAPTWRSAFNRGMFGAVIFFLLFWLAFSRPVGSAIALSAVMLVIYVPMGYYVDRFFFRRRLRQLHAQRAAEKAERRGGRN
jgi:drug/metabolite transporter (DMT)-like permease